MTAALLLTLLTPFVFADSAGETARIVVEEAQRRISGIPPLLPPPPNGDRAAKKPVSARGFLEGLSSPSTLAPLRSRRAFKSFLRRHKVPRRLVPGFLMLQRLMENAEESDFKELAHILPTAVSFLRDGHAVTLDKKSHSYYGMTVGGGSGSPVQIALSGKTAKLHPLLRAKTLAHEFQHVYDQSVLRTWPQEAMEARAQKVAILVLDLARKTRTKEYDRLRRSKSYEAREIVKDSQYCLTALREGNLSFVRAVGFGQCRRRIPEPMALAQFSLRSVLDPESGVPAHLKALLIAKNRKSSLLADLSRQRLALLEEMRKSPTPIMEDQLASLDRNLAEGKGRVQDIEAMILSKKNLLRKAAHELDWLKAKDGPAAAYDLHLQVDEDFIKAPGQEGPAGR